MLYSRFNGPETAWFASGALNVSNAGTFAGRMFGTVMQGAVQSDGNHRLGPKTERGIYKEFP